MVIQRLTHGPAALLSLKRTLHCFNIYRGTRPCMVNYSLFYRDTYRTFTKSPIGDCDYHGLPVKPLYFHFEQHLHKKAIVDENGAHSYKELLILSNKLSDRILSVMKKFPVHLDSPLGKKNLPRIVILCPNNMSYVISLCSIWLTRGIAVPLNLNYPMKELEYFVSDSKPSVIITTAKYKDKISTMANYFAIPIVTLGSEDYNSINCGTELTADGVWHGWQSKFNRLNQLCLAHKLGSDSALIIYTSGTTGPPKGVVHTMKSLNAQITAMVDEWKWHSGDVALHVLPLHHVHGIVNVLLTSLHVGACCYMLEKFNPAKVWDIFSAQDSTIPVVSIFHAVPTIYVKLLQYFSERYQDDNGYLKSYFKAACRQNIRLMVCGSAPLPAPVKHQWLEMTGHTLLERYGMTEIGMGVTQPLDGVRVDGCGAPFSNVQLCIAKSNVYAEMGYDPVVYMSKVHTQMEPGARNEPGELLVKSTSMFKGYWGKPEATQQSFTPDGWFKTGDTAELVEHPEGGNLITLLGRQSVDIIKSGGYKISALDVEQVMLSSPDVKEVAIVGLTDLVWGQKVAAIVVLDPQCDGNEENLKEFLSDKLATHKIPSVFKFVPEIPRNLMGKINKKTLVQEVFGKTDNTHGR